MSASQPGVGAVGPRTRVLIVDDVEWVRGALAVVLSVHDDMQVVGEAANGRDAVSLCGTVWPDVVLMDLILPVMDGVTAIRLIRQEYPQIQCVGLTGSSDPALKQRAVDAGAFCCLFKTSSTDEIVDCIRAAKASATSSPP